MSHNRFHFSSIPLHFTLFGGGHVVVSDGSYQLVTYKYNFICFFPDPPFVLFPFYVGVLLGPCVARQYALNELSSPVLIFAFIYRLFVCFSSFWSLNVLPEFFNK
jgi:hypothetical protein